jgi:hypothetical protein
MTSISYAASASKSGGRPLAAKTIAVRTPDSRAEGGGVTAAELVELLRATDPEPMRLRAENRELRRIAGVLLTWVVEHEDLAAFMRGLIDRRWS